MNTPLLDGISKEAGFDLYHKDSGALTSGGAITIAGGGALGGSALVEIIRAIKAKSLDVKRFSGKGALAGMIAAPALAFGLSQLRKKDE